MFIQDCAVSLSIENFVSSINIKINGNIIGKERTGYKVAFEFAFAIIAAIIVDVTAIPMLPKKNADKKITQFATLKLSKNIRKRMMMNELIRKMSARLKRSFPKNMFSGVEISWSSKVVPLSSSDTNARESPDIAVKNITTQKIPDVK